MTEAKTTRRWLQFSIASLIGLMTTAAIASYGICEHRERVRLQDALLERVFTADLDIPVPFGTGFFVPNPPTQ